MTDKENHTLPVALLITGIVCIMILSCCFVWLVIRCERWRRRRKYGKRYSINASRHANGEELKDLRNLKPSVNLIQVRKPNLSKSIPSLDSVVSEPLFHGGNYEDDVDHSGGNDVSIARILGSFPDLPYYTSSNENVTSSSRGPSNNVPVMNIPPLRSSSIATSLYSENNAIRPPDLGSVNTLSSTESLKVQVPGGAIRIRYMTDNFQFTRLKGRKGKGSGGGGTVGVGVGVASTSTPNITTIPEGDKEEKKEEPVFETEV